MFVNLAQTVPNVYVQAVITIETSDGIYDLQLINKTIDGCKFLHNPGYEPIVQVFYRELTRTGTFPKRCPFTKV